MIVYKKLKEQNWVTSGHNLRFKGRERRARVANLYLPLVAICIDNLNKLHAWLADGESRIAGTNPNDSNSLIMREISGLQAYTVSNFEDVFLLA